MTEICFGTWAWGNKLVWDYDSQRDDYQLEKTFLQAINGGLTLIDTADSYGIGNHTGRSEKLLGNFIENIQSDKKKKLRIATKLAPFPWRVGRNGFKKAFEASNNRLKGNIHRIQLHWSTAKYAPWQEAQLIDGLADIYKANCIPEIGISNTGPKRLRWMQARLKDRGIQIKSLQIQMSLLSPEPKKEIIIKETCKELNIDLLAYSPLALGILTIPPNKYSYPSGILRKKLFERLLPKTTLIREALFNIGRDRKVSQAQVALNWCRANGASPIVGMRTVFQAKEAILASKWKLSKNEKEYLDKTRHENNTYMPGNPFMSE